MPTLVKIGLVASEEKIFLNNLHRMDRQWIPSDSNSSLAPLDQVR